VSACAGYTHVKCALTTFGDFHFTASWAEKGRFPTLSKTKLSAQA